MSFMDWYTGGSLDKAERLRIIADDSVREVELRKGDDVMEVSVTEDGRYRADVRGSISSINHGNADSFLSEIARVLGGVLKVTKHSHGAHAHHHHHHGHEHKH